MPAVTPFPPSNAPAGRDVPATGTINATLAVGTVTTSAPGSPGAAEIVGPYPDYTLNLTIPQGPQGDQGDPGPTGPAVADGDKGDITVSSSGTVWTIKNLIVSAAKLATDAVTTAKILAKAVTFAKMQDIATGRFLGRSTAGTGPIEELTSAQVVAMLGVGGLPTGYISGLTLANNVVDATNDIDIAAGKARSSDDAEDMVLAAALTKRLDASWAVGSGNGGLDTGTIANAWYHLHLIKRTDTGVVDVLFSLSATAPTLPTNYTKFRRIGAIWRTGGAIRAFVQAGNQFLWAASIRDVSSGTPSNLPGTYYTLSVPPGVQVDAIVSALTIGNALSYNKLRSPDQPASIASATDFDAASDATTTLSNIQVERRTDTTARLFASCSSSATTMSIVTHGWNDPL